VHGVSPECLPFLAISLCCVGEIVKRFFVSGHCDAFDKLYAQEKFTSKGDCDLQQQLNQQLKPAKENCNVQTLDQQQ
jgi:hypothetical protein